MIQAPVQHSRDGFTVSAILSSRPLCTIKAETAIGALLINVRPLKGVLLPDNRVLRESMNVTEMQ